MSTPVTCSTCGSPLPVDGTTCSRCAADGSTLPARLGPIERLVVALYSPRTVMSDIARAPRPLAPWIACASLVIALAVARHTLVDPSTAAAAYTGHRALTPDRIAAMQSYYEKGTLSSEVIVLIGYLAIWWSSAAWIFGRAARRLGKSVSHSLALNVWLIALWPEQLVLISMILIQFAWMPLPVTVGEFREIGQFRHIFPGVTLPAFVFLPFSIGSALVAERHLRIGFEHAFGLSSADAKAVRNSGCVPVIVLALAIAVVLALLRTHLMPLMH